MSTNFSVKAKGQMIEVAHRYSGGFTWENDLAPLLSNARKAYATDNTQQGIHTIGDIKKAITTGNICPKEK